MPQLNTNIFSIFNNKLNNTTPFNFSDFGNLTQSTRLSGNMGNDIVATAKNTSDTRKVTVHTKNLPVEEQKHGAQIL